MEEKTMQAWEKVLEYASVPLHGTMSRRIRKGVCKLMRAKCMRTPSFLSAIFLCELRKTAQERKSLILITA
ncbi:hypothetical protein Ctha_0818 [Chloroherpeton thalassium ATCC 35110]|uniref:Uncharacterized protein n=1 Tax=Chloroherpeton thalassium (strain ATCC 35110 / GB-78) TaxID=517418 RepID=B3QWS2_CHLT3|nr:hypothetical protein Ctha_0818 [Chloroherpeton thalassium ATCC 35110]